MISELSEVVSEISSVSIFIDNNILTKAVFDQLGTVQDFSKKVGSRITSNPCGDIRDVLKMPEGTTMSPEQQRAIREAMDRINEAAPDSVVGMLREQLLDIYHDNPDFQITILESPVFAGYAETVPQDDHTGSPHDTNVYRIYVDFDKLSTPGAQDPVTSIFNVFSSFTPALTANDVMGTIIHELGHVWSYEYYPPYDAELVNMTPSEIEKSETHAERWEAGYIREKIGFTYPVGGGSPLYDYLNTNHVVVSFIADFALYSHHL